MPESSRTLQLRLLQELYAQAFLKVLEVRSAMPPRDSLPEGFTEVETFFGTRMKVLASECVSQSIAAQGFFEPGLCAMLILFLKPGMFFFDVGAHYGFHSLLASRLVGRRGVVHAFEPTQATWDILHENASGAGNIQAHRFAFWSSSGPRLFRDCGAAYSAFNTFFEPRFISQKGSPMGEEKVLVETKTVDQFVREQNVAPDMIKIDAESAELEILKGMDRTLAEYRPMITLEVGDEAIAGVCSTRELIKYLTEKGYKPFEYRGGKVVEHGLRDHYEYDNLLFLPSDGQTNRV